MKWFWYGQEKGLPCMNDKLKAKKKIPDRTHSKWNENELRKKNIEIKMKMPTNYWTIISFRFCRDFQWLH